MGLVHLLLICGHQCDHCSIAVRGWATIVVAGDVKHWARRPKTVCYHVLKRIRSFISKV